MAKLWQLKKISSGEGLSEPQLLPENWGPIFGMEAIKDQLGDLSWLGEQFQDHGWFEVGDAPEPEPDPEPVIPPAPEPEPPITLPPLEYAVKEVKNRLAESDWAMLPDVPLSKGKKQEWVDYRHSLREIKYQDGYPENINWPSKPE